MPTVSVFIRKNDLAQWKELPNKSEWLHNYLQMEKLKPVPEMINRERYGPPGHTLLPITAPKPKYHLDVKAGQTAVTTRVAEDEPTIEANPDWGA